MNKIIEELALDAGLLNYVDNETPRRCFVCNNADLEHVEKFTQLLLRHMVNKVRDVNLSHMVYTTYDRSISESCKYSIIRRLEELL